MEARWRSVTEGVPCQIRGWVGWRGVHECPNPSHSFLKTANVSFEDIIPFGHQIALGNYESLRGMYGITRSGYQCVQGRREFNLNSGWRFRRYIWSDMLINHLKLSKRSIWLYIFKVWQDHYSLFCLLLWCFVTGSCKWTFSKGV